MTTATPAATVYADITEHAPEYVPSLITWDTFEKATCAAANVMLSNAAVAYQEPDGDTGRIEILFTGTPVYDPLLSIQWASDVVHAAARFVADTFPVTESE